MGLSTSQFESHDDDYPGTAFLAQRRKAILSRSYESEEQKRQHMIKLNDWRRNESAEEREWRHKNLPSYRSKPKVYNANDIVNWETNGWNLPNISATASMKAKRKYAINSNINKRVALLRGDIMALEIDAVTNAANNAMLGGGGIDGAIHAASGPLLMRDTAAMNGLKTGRAKISKGYNLPARYIIHTAGPTEENATELISSYNSVLDLAVKHNIKTLAICCISTGIFGFPLAKATEIALRTVREYLEKRPDLDIYIIFVMFLAKEESVYNKLMPIYFPVGHDNNKMPDDPVIVEQRRTEEEKKRRREEAEENSSVTNKETPTTTTTIPERNEAIAEDQTSIESTGLNAQQNDISEQHKEKAQDCQPFTSITGLARTEEVSSQYSQPDQQ